MSRARSRSVRATEKLRGFCKYGETSAKRLHASGVIWQGFAKEIVNVKEISTCVAAHSPSLSVECATTLHP